MSLRKIIDRLSAFPGPCLSARSPGVVNVSLPAHATGMEDYAAKEALPLVCMR